MGREEAARLVERYGTMVYRLAYAKTGSREDAEDITQETFLRLVRAAPAFREEEHFDYYEEMSMAEIARVLGKREGSIRTRLNRARKMLRCMRPVPSRWGRQ